MLSAAHLVVKKGKLALAAARYFRLMLPGA